MVMGGRRQVGSTIKPFLYALAMQNGMTPCSTAPNVQRSYGGWTPRNGSRARYGQQVPLAWGLKFSNNWISAYLITLLGTSPFVGILHDFGLNNPDIEKYLGNMDINFALPYHGHIFTAMVRNNLHFDGSNRGAIELNYSFPIFNSGFYGYLRYFNGYGESLADYKRSVNKIGIGLSFVEF